MKTLEIKRVSKNSSIKNTASSKVQELKEAIAVSPEEDLCILYNVQDKTEKMANAYAETEQLSHRYLAYRDLPTIFKQYVKGSKALDYGTGTGLSASFLHDAGFCVVGVDISSIMLQKARDSFPHLRFCEIEKLRPKNKFDLVFSSLVLFDMKSKNEMIKYLKNGEAHLNKNGIFVVITGSEELYSVSKNWIAYDSNFSENRNLKSGDVAKLRLKTPPIEFHDFYWKEIDYIECIRKSNLKILKIHKPLGNEDDPYLWSDERFFAPFTIYVLRKH